MLSIVQLSRFFVVVFRDSHIRLSHLSSLVNNFFYFFQTVLFDSFVSRDSFVRLTQSFSFVNNFFNLFFCRFLAIQCALRDSFVRISPHFTNVNIFFHFFSMFLYKYNSKKTRVQTPMSFR